MLELANACPGPGATVLYHLLLAILYSYLESDYIVSDGSILKHSDIVYFIILTLNLPKVLSTFAQQFINVHFKAIYFFNGRLGCLAECLCLMLGMLSLFSLEDWLLLDVSLISLLNLIGLLMGSLNMHSFVLNIFWLHLRFFFAKDLVKDSMVPGLLADEIVPL